MNKILTTAKAAQLLGVSVRTAQLWVENGQLESWKTPGGHRRIKLQSVLNLTEIPQIADRSMTATAVILASAGRSDAWLNHGLKGLGLLLCVTETPFKAATLAAEHLPMLIIVEDPEDSERSHLLETLYRDPLFQSVTFVAVETQGSIELYPRTRCLQTPKHSSVKATANQLINALKSVEKRTATFPLPWNEQERLRAVMNSSLLSSRMDHEFDGIVRLAAKATQSPIAMFTLLTSEEQYFKSRTGFEGARTPRDWAFCNETLIANELTILNNLTSDDRFASNPTLSDPYNFRFYAGAPVRDSNGFALGSICVIDYVPRLFTQEDREALATTADVASRLIQLDAPERKMRKLQSILDV
ncbi:MULTISPECIES: excisionase family DNA-binding protein [unclassified Phyllobacterium]|uniref:excisionase family DNA-binding protein n=1 Tax=unclassified Phyllobacterium TaxID=2638441 RepID=UPI003012A9EA